jgi:hypothetical protein
VCPYRFTLIPPILSLGLTIPLGWAHEVIMQAKKISPTICERNLFACNLDTSLWAIFTMTP